MNVPPPLGASAGAKTDMAEVLKGVKLPERREVASAASAKTYEVKTFDTALGADVKMEQEKARDDISSKPPMITTMPKNAASAKEAGAANVVSADPLVYAAPEVDTQKTSVVVPVHTLKDDLQHVVQDQKVSLVRAASLEEDRRHRDGAPESAQRSGASQRSRRTFGILFSVLLLMLLSGGALFGVYTIEKSRTGTPSPAPTASSILFAENIVSFPLANQSPSALKELLAQARTSPQGALGSITQIVPTISQTAADGTATQIPATFAQFMQAIGANPPDDLVRALSSDFFFGIHTVDTNAPLIVVPVISYDRAFAGMLEWEPTLNTDLSPVFAAVPAQTTNASGLPVIRSFSDVVMRNYDVRALKDDAGNIVMYYSFPTQNILIIAESPYTFTEVLSRLQAQRKL